MLLISLQFLLLLVIVRARLKLIYFIVYFQLYCSFSFQYVIVSAAATRLWLRFWQWHQRLTNIGRTIIEVPNDAREARSTGVPRGMGFGEGRRRPSPTWGFWSIAPRKILDCVACKSVHSDAFSCQPLRQIVCTVSTLFTTIKTTTYDKLWGI